MTDIEKLKKLAEALVRRSDWRARKRGVE